MNRVTLGRIVRPRGMKGEVLLEGSGRDPDEFLEFTRLAVGDLPVSVESAWSQGGRIVLKFRGIDTLEQAQGLRDRELTLPAEDRPPAPDGEYYLGDLIGCAVVDAESGTEYGVVEDCLEYGGPVLLQVMKDGRELLVPFVDTIYTSVDVGAKRICVKLPEGLTEL